MWEKTPIIRNELSALESYMGEKFPRKNSFLDEVSQKIFSSGGKRLRPALTILSSMFGSYSREKVFPVAAAIETLHTATLVHDDIVDQAKTRRGQPTVSNRHGVSLAVYTGDYLLIKSVLLLAEAGLPADKLHEAARALEAICLGEVDQYFGRNRIPSFREYLKRVMKKTGVLLAASCALGAYTSGCSEEQTKILARFGMYFGVAFQIRDDLMDIESTDENEAGKPVIHDLKEGFVTLPAILAASRNESVRKQLETYFVKGGDLKILVTGIILAGGAQEARRLKERYTQKCFGLLKSLPEGEKREALEEAVRWLDT